MVFTGAVALFTLLLVAATVMLYCAGEKQLRFAIRSNVKQARDMRASIDAATEAARIARNAERPYLTPFEPELRNWTKAIEEFNPFELLEVHLDITNIGKGVGFIESYA